MALSRKAKIWITLLSIPVVLVIAGAITLKLYFTSERLKAIVIPALEEATSRRVSISDISLSVFPSLAVEIDTLVIANRVGPGFSEKPFVMLDRLVLDVRILALLKNTFEVSTVILDRPRILVEVNEQGQSNYADERKPEEKDGEVKVTVDAKTGGFLLSNLQVVNGVLEYVNRKENSATTMEGVNARVRMELVPAVQELRITTRSTVDNLSYGTALSPLISGLRLTLDQPMVYQGEKDVLLLQDGRGTIQDIALTVNGTVTNLTGRFMMDIVVASADVNVADLLSLAPKEYMRKADGLKGEGLARVRITVSGTVDDTTKADIAGEISATDARIQYAQLPKPITNVNIVADFTKTRARQEFRLTKFSASLGNNPFSATMSVVNFDDPALAMAVQASLRLAEVKEYYPLEPGTQLSGTLKANVNIAGKVSTPSAMRASGAMEFDRVTIRTPTSERPIENLNGTITFNNQVVETKRLSMTLGSSDLTLGFWLRNYLSLMSDDKAAPKPVANLTLVSNRLATADIMSSKTDAGAQKEGAGKAQQSGVPLPDVAMDVSASIGKLEMEKFELTNVRGTMKIASGIIQLQNFSGNTFDGSIASRGSLNLQKPERPLFDLALDVEGVSASPMLSQFTSFGQRLFGKLTMNTTLKGALDDTMGLVPQALNGGGNVRVEQGQLVGMKVNSAIAGLLALPDMEQINFKDWANSFTIADGRIVIKDLRINALGGDYVVNGSQGLDGSLDYTLSILLSERTSGRVTVPGFAGEAVNLLKDESGRVKLDLAVGGTTDQPKVSLDTRAAQKRAEDKAKQKLTEEAKKLEDQLKKKGEDALKNLFKKK